MTTATCAQPTDPIPPLLAPRIRRDPEGAGVWAWRAECDIDPAHCYISGPTRQDLVERTTGEGLRWWLRHAAKCAARRGLTCISLRPSASSLGDVEPFDSALDPDPRPCKGGDWWTCGLPDAYPPIRWGRMDAADEATIRRLYEAGSGLCDRTCWANGSPGPR